MRPQQDTAKIPPPLTGVACSVLRADARLEALPHVADLISSTDVSLRLSLADAAATGSLRLFDRVALRIQSDPAIHPALRDHYVSRAMEAAIQRDDLVLVQRIHKLHPEPLVAKSMGLAINHGSLELVQWVVGNRSNRLCCPPGIRYLCAMCAISAMIRPATKDVYRVFRWLMDEGGVPLYKNRQLFLPVNAALPHCVDILRWVDDSSIRIRKWSVKRVALDAVRVGNWSVIEYFLTSTYLYKVRNSFRCILIHAACHPQREEIVEKLLASELCDSIRGERQFEPRHPGDACVLQFSERLLTIDAGNVLRLLVAKAPLYSHLDMMKWLVESCGVTSLKVSAANLPDQQKTLEIFQWLRDTGVGKWKALDVATLARDGYLDVIKWVYTYVPAHPALNAMFYAATYGHLETVQWLDENVFDAHEGDMLGTNAPSRYAHVVKWFVENRRDCDPMHTLSVAALNGHLESVVWLVDNCPNACAWCVRELVLWNTLGHWDSSQQGMPMLNVLWWLDAHTSRAARCTGDCVGTRRDSKMWNCAIAASEAGEVELLSYLHHHHTEVFAFDRDHRSEVARRLVAAGHVAIVRWWFLNRQAHVDWQELRRCAEEEMQSEILTWWWRSSLNTIRLDYQ